MIYYLTITKNEDPHESVWFTKLVHTWALCESLVIYLYWSINIIYIQNFLCGTKFLLSYKDLVKIISTILILWTKYSIKNTVKNKTSTKILKGFKDILMWLITNCFTIFFNLIHFTASNGAHGLKICLVYIWLFRFVF